LFIIALGCAILILVLIAELLESLADLFNEFKRPWLWLSIIAACFIIGGPILFHQILQISVSQFAAGLWGMAVLMILIFLGFPIGFVMGFVGILGTWYLRDFNCSMMVVQMTVLDSVADYFFTVVPLFVGMGFVCFAANLSKDLYNSFHTLFGGVPGALAMASVAACGGFAAICGDSGATGATMGSVAIPEMLKNKYKSSLATGCIAAGGTLGILIPPSVGFIIYGLLTEQSIGKLFMAGIIPGICLILLYLAAIYVQCKIDPDAGPVAPSYPIYERLIALRGVWPIALLIFVVMGGMYTGIFTATEAGAVGLIMALLIGIVLRRFTWESLRKNFMETVSVTAMIFVIMIGVSLLNNFIALSELPLVLGNWVAGLNVSRYIIYVLILAIYLLLGCAMNIIPMMMLTLPIIYPVIVSLGFNPIWFGVIMVIMMEVGQVTPPVGLNVYIISGVAKDVPMAEVFKGILPFIAMQALMILLLTIFPDIAMFLPDYMGGLPPIGD
jgi:tripartite ATP-independent transporter DctM subunit